MSNVSAVIGSTGLVGKNVVLELGKKNIKTIAISRTEISDLPDNIDNIRIDFDSFIQNHNFPICDHIYICLGTTIKKAGSKEKFTKVDFDYCLAMAKKARLAGATKISLVSSVGANSKTNNFYLKTKGELEEAIKKIDFSIISIYRPSLLIGKRKENRLLERFGQSISLIINPFLLGSLKKYRSIDVKILASCIVNSKKNYSLKYFYYDDFF